MKNSIKRFSLFLCFCVLLLLTGCKSKSDDLTDDTKEYTFTAEVVSLSEDTLLVRPENETREDKMTAQIYVPVDTTIVLSDETPADAAALANASRVQITYDGVMDDSDPALISNCYQIQILE